jgi:ribosomal-protein-alanine acetyltransferase
MQTDERTRPKVRPLRQSDIEAVIQITRQSPQAASWSPTSHEQFLTQNGAVAFASEVGTQMTGFVIGRQIADQAEILNLAVALESRHHGHGSTLLLAALEEFQRRGSSRIFLEVRSSNAGALAFYQEHGFVKTGRREAYYRNPDEDALILEKKLTA